MKETKGRADLTKDLYRQKPCGRPVDVNVYGEEVSSQARDAVGFLLVPVLSYHNP
jgi:hypothetical protein